MQRGPSTRDQENLLRQLLGVYLLWWKSQSVCPLCLGQRRTCKVVEKLYYSLYVHCMSCLCEFPRWPSRLVYIRTQTSLMNWQTAIAANFPFSSPSPCFASLLTQEQTKFRMAKEDDLKVSNTDLPLSLDLSECMFIRPNDKIWAAESWIEGFR